MRIALVNNFFYPRVSGSAHLTEALGAGLAARGHDVLILTSAQGSCAGEEQRNGYTVVRFPCRALPKIKLAMNYDVNFVTSAANVRRVFRALDAFGPDLIHQHGQFFDLTWITAVWARRRNVPAALTVHTALTHTTPAFAATLWLGDELLVRPFIGIGRPTLGVVDQFMLAYVRRRYHLPASRVQVLPLAVDVDRFGAADGQAVRDRLGIGDRPMVLSIGHVIPLRDRLALVEALPRLTISHPDVAVVVVGTVHDDRFLQRAAQLGVIDHLILTGAIPYDQVPGYVAAADIESHDLQGYGLGTASLEVMASGVPVIAVVRPDNFPGLELVNWENIVIVPPDDPEALADAMARLLRDRDLAQHVGVGQREFIMENFSLPSVIEHHEKFYGSLLYGPSA
jgi:1,2-diacylglycerol 3-alpha-glucosyltransferase